MFYQERCSLQLAAMLVTTELTVGGGDYGQGLFSVFCVDISHIVSVTMEMLVAVFR